MKIPASIQFFPFYQLSYLPLSFLYLFSDFAYFILYRLLKYRKEVVRDNLSNSFPNKSIEELRRIEKAFYKHFCDTFIESLKSLTISNKEAKTRFNVINPELAQKYYNLNKSITLYSAHQGNWEWLGYLPLYVSHQMTSFYQPLSSHYFDQLMLQIRRRFGVICIESSKGYRTLTKLKDEGILTMNIIIGDQSPMNNSSKYWIQFLHQNTAFLIGADRIAKKSEHVVLFPCYTKIKRGYYQIELKLITDQEISKSGTEVMDKYAEQLETAIQNSPEMWLWSHRRWKLKMEESNLHLSSQNKN